MQKMLNSRGEQARQAFAGWLLSGQCTLELRFDITRRRPATSLIASASTPAHCVW
jgi:hypothetical protein